MRERWSKKLFRAAHRLTYFPPMTDAIVFDLDSCISAADEPGRELFQPAFSAIERTSRESHFDGDLAGAFADMWRLPFDHVAKKRGFTPAMVEAGWSAFLKIEVATPMRGYGDLDELRALPVQRFLVTSGFRRLQESKIRALGIAPLFQQIVVDAIDEPGAKGKRIIIEGMIRDHGLDPARMLIVGDNADSELAAGRALGIRTVQTLRPGVPRDPNAAHHIGHFRELKALLQP